MDQVHILWQKLAHAPITQMQWTVNFHMILPQNLKVKIIALSIVNTSNVDRASTLQDKKQSIR